MELVPFWFEGLAQASYLLVDGRDAIVVDPALEAEWYLDAARERGAEIRHVLETHVHADFVSGNVELADACGATLWMGPGARPAFAARTLEHGLELPFGNRVLQVRHTPGHTPDSSTFIVPPARGAVTEPHLALTGDTLFVGDVGRPDLAANAETTVTDMARMLYASVAGSLCGKCLGAARSTTIGAERLTNPALLAGDEAGFVQYVTNELPAQPRYFVRAVAANRRGPVARAAYAAGLRAMTPVAVRDALAAGAVLLDTRDEDIFPLGHVPGAVSIAVSGRLGAWAGCVLAPEAPVILLCAPGTEKELALELQRVAWEPPVGYLEGGYEAWVAAGLPTTTLTEWEPAAVQARLAAGEALPQILDVRAASEFDEGHVPGAVNLPLTQLAPRMGELDPAASYLTVCATGYRSVIAASVLRHAGFTAVSNLRGGAEAMAAESAQAS